MPPHLSIILCTRNRAEKLARCLSSLEDTSLPDHSWEVIVVDNGSSDSTKYVIDAALCRGKIPITSCIEPQIGLSFARNRGIAQAAGRIIAFTDDDCLVDKRWLRAILSEFDQDPDLDVLGGRVNLADIRDLPFCIRSFPDRCAITSLPQILERLIGCNMTFRRSVFDRVGLFDTTLGAGTLAGSSEDTDLFYRALQTGLKMSYSPDVILRHAHGRTPAQPLDPIHFGYAKGRGAWYCKNLLRGDWQVAKYLGVELLSIYKNLYHNRPTEPTTLAPRKLLHSLFAGAITRLNKAA